MDYIELIKLNKECQLCKRLKHNGGKCIGKKDNFNCILFINIKATEE